MVWSSKTSSQVSELLLAPAAQGSNFLNVFSVFCIEIKADWNTSQHLPNQNLWNVFITFRPSKAETPLSTLQKRLQTYVKWDQIQLTARSDVKKQSFCKMFSVFTACLSSERSGSPAGCRPWPFGPFFLGGSFGPARGCSKGSEAHSCEQNAEANRKSCKVQDFEGSTKGDRLR